MRFLTLLLLSTAAVAASTQRVCPLPKEIALQFVQAVGVHSFIPETWRDEDRAHPVPLDLGFHMEGDGSLTADLLSKNFGFLFQANPRLVHFPAQLGNCTESSGFDGAISYECPLAVDLAGYRALYTVLVPSRDLSKPPRLDPRVYVESDRHDLFGLPSFTMEGDVENLQLPPAPLQVKADRPSCIEVPVIKRSSLAKSGRTPDI
jgi:hypothetical protein